MEKYFPCKTRPDSDPSLVPTLFCYAMLKSQESDRVPRCNQFRTVRRKPVEREEESGKRGGARRESVLSLAGGTYGHLAAQWREFKSASRYASHSLA